MLHTGISANVQNTYVEQPQECHWIKMDSLSKMSFILANIFQKEATFDDWTWLFPMWSLFHGIPNFSRYLICLHSFFKCLFNLDIIKFSFFSEIGSIQDLSFPIKNKRPLIGRLDIAGASLVGGGARGLWPPQHFEIYLIGTNFVFKKLKFYIDSSPRNFFSPPNSKCRWGPWIQPKNVQTLF